MAGQNPKRLAKARPRAPQNPTTPFTYDQNGNMLTGLGGKIMEYDGENRPLSVTFLGKKTCYVYGVDGKRLKKVEGLSPATLCTALPPAANVTTYFGPVEVRNWLGAEQVLTYPQPSIKLTNGVATWLHFDHLGSVRAITDATGAKVESAIYRPFGEQSEWLLPGNPSPETKGWIGERYDADAGLQYLNARYYDPALGLFLQPDWFEVTKPGVGTNRFSYSFNDPVNKIDPGGNDAIDDELRRIANDYFWREAKQAQVDGFAAGKQLGSIALDVGIGSIPIAGGIYGAATAETWGGVALNLGGELLGPAADLVKGGYRVAKAGEGLAKLSDGLRPLNGAVGAASSTPKGFTTFVDGNGALVHVSPGGLKYGPDRKYGNSVDHVLSHTVADPSKKKHSVFNEQGDDALALVDEAWANRGSSVPGDQMAFVVEMGRPVGTNGETAIRVIADPKSGYIVTAYPW